MRVSAINIRTKTGPVADAKIIDDSKEVYVVSEQAQVLRTNLSEIRSMGRATQGVTIFKPAAGDFVSSIAVVSDLDLDGDDDTADPKANGKGEGKTKGNGKSNGKAKNGNGKQNDAEQPPLTGLE